MEKPRFQPTRLTGCFGDGHGGIGRGDLGPANRSVQRIVGRHDVGHSTTITVTIHHFVLHDLAVNGEFVGSAGICLDRGDHGQRQQTQEGMDSIQLDRHLTSPKVNNEKLLGA